MRKAEELFTLTVDIIGCWKEVLNLTDTPSIMEVEVEVLKEAMSMSVADSTEVVKNLQ